MGDLRVATPPTGPGFLRLGAALISQKVITESNLSTLENYLDQLKPFDPIRRS